MAVAFNSQLVKETKMDTKTTWTLRSQLNFRLTPMSGCCHASYTDMFATLT